MAIDKGCDYLSDVFVMMIFGLCSLVFELESRFILASPAGSLSWALTSVFANFRRFGFRHTPALPSQLCHPLARTEDTSDETWHAHLHIQLVPVQRRARGITLTAAIFSGSAPCKPWISEQGTMKTTPLRSLTIKRSFALS